MKSFHPMSLLLFALLLISCGGGGGGTLSADGGGIGGSGIIARGPITAFGSVIVNGTSFDTIDAEIIVEGEEVGIGNDILIDNLDVGKVVIVEGTKSQDNNRFMADRVTYNDDVQGPVERIQDIDITTKEIVVLGQTVILNVLTEFKGITLDALAQNDVVAVSGLVDDTGAIWATFLEKTGEFLPGMVVEVKGLVKNLNIDLKTFKINDLTVHYSFADTSDLPGGVPAEGLLVEVEGTLDDTGGEMLAMEVDLADELGDEDVDDIEVTGFLTDFVSALEFTVGYQLVQTDVDTVFVDGAPEDLALGVKLEAEGRLVDGILFAREIEFWDPDQIELEGIVTDVVSIYEFTVGNQVVQTDATTVFVDGMPEDVALNVKIEVKGKMVDGILVADKVSFEQI